ncbi:MAG: hypothetical protein FJ144_16725 [Deltaproteobacteria bacterium]|nr:hypothetical protein [Deltaproteobacteria bacterium]
MRSSILFHVSGIFLSALAALASPALAQETSVREFVTRIRPDGFQFNEAVEIAKPSDVPALLEMLRDPSMARYRPNIVLTLGAVGDPAAKDPLLELVKNPGSLTPPATFRDQTEATKALGYLLNKTNDAEILNFLVARAKMDVAAATGGLAASMSPSQQQMARVAILALGLSGTDQARSALSSMSTRVQAAIGPGGPSPSEEGVDDVVSQALKDNREIKQEGLEKYYAPATR